MICGRSELACAVLSKNPSRNEFAKSLISITEYCVICGNKDKDLVPLMMDTLVVIGDLTASENFHEAIFFVDNNLFAVLRNALDSPSISSIESSIVPPAKKAFSPKAPPLPTEATSTPDLDYSALTKLKFQETVVWTVSNAVADD